jgi:2,3-diaminopropionate biosynthesis protein SbnA
MLGVLPNMNAGQTSLNKKRRGFGGGETAISQSRSVTKPAALELLAAKVRPIDELSWPTKARSEMVGENLLSAIGRTPLIRLSSVFPGMNCEVFGKLESLNPGGSAKDRAAYSMIAHALKTGEITADTTIIESSSGNMAIGLALVCACLGLRLICVVDSKTTEHNVNILRTYGAEVDMVSTPDPVSGEFLTARLARVQALVREIPNSLWMNQYANRYNALGHFQTLREIHQALGDRIDFLFCPTSTCGTIKGCKDYLAQCGLATKVVAVDAVGSVIFGDKPGRRLLPGMGAAIRPGLSEGLKVDKVVHVSDWDCIVGCRRLVRDAGILAGGSSGGVVIAAERMRDEIPTGGICVLILPDRGERYLDSIFSDTWVREHFGEQPR